MLAELGVDPATIVTLDALHCQKLFECAASAKVTLIVQVKDNQRILLQHCRNIAAASRPITADYSHTQGRNRDVTMGEDRSRIRTKPGVFARLRSFAFNINKANRFGNMNQDRYRAALAGIENLLKFRGMEER